MLKFLKNRKNNRHQIQKDFDKKLIYSLSKSKIPNLKQLKYVSTFLNSFEKKIMKVCIITIVLSSFFWTGYFIKNHLQIVPKVGGKYTEGLIGTPQFINPIFAGAGDADNDIVKLVFSSIFKRGRDGELVNDLAESYQISPDTKEYTIKIKSNAHWHTGDKLTVDDIIFTFNAVKDPIYKSPLRQSFSGVNIERVDDQTVKFILPEPYTAFLELLTFGILPQNLWLQISPEAAGLAELNLKPIGSGPYKFKSLIKDKSGRIRDYNLERNDDYYGDKPFIQDLDFKFYINFEEAISALNSNVIQGISYLPHTLKENVVAKDSLSFIKLNLPQINAVFFNQKTNASLSDKKVRQALAHAIDKNAIIADVLNGDARTVNGPILPNNFAYNQDLAKYNFNKDEAGKLLDESGWKLKEITEEQITKAQTDSTSEDEAVRKQAELIISLGAGKWRAKDEKNFLIVTLTTVDSNDNSNVSEQIKTAWENVGVRTFITITPINQIQTDVIKPRNFQALLYGQVVGNDPDSYVYWHSTQVGENGFNIANYANTEVDSLLEDARISSSTEIRKEKYKTFQKIIADDIPAIFLYSPLYTYIQEKTVKGFNAAGILVPADRFSNISQWYIKTGKKIVF